MDLRLGHLASQVTVAHPGWSTGRDGIKYLAVIAYQLFARLTAAVNGAGWKRSSGFIGI